MPTVYCLQHTDYHDPRTGDHFTGIKPKKVREETDHRGRVLVYRAHSVCEDVDEADVPYYEGRPHLFYIPDVSEAPEAPPEGPHSLEHRAGPWYDVVNEDGDPVNEKALKEDEATELRDDLNRGSE